MEKEEQLDVLKDYLTLQGFYAENTYGRVVVKLPFGEWAFIYRDVRWNLLSNAGSFDTREMYPLVVILNGLHAVGFTRDDLVQPHEMNARHNKCQAVLDYMKDEGHGFHPVNFKDDLTREAVLAFDVEKWHKLFSAAGQNTPSDITLGLMMCYVKEQEWT